MGCLWPWRRLGGMAYLGNFKFMITTTTRAPSPADPHLGAAPRRSGPTPPTRRRPATHIAPFAPTGPTASDQARTDLANASSRFPESSRRVGARRGRPASGRVASRGRTRRKVPRDRRPPRTAGQRAGSSRPVEIKQCVGCTRQFFPKSFLGDDAAVLARSSGEEPASPRHRAGMASMAWRMTLRFSTNAP